MFRNVPVPIANPLPDGKHFTSQKRALHLVRSGRAEFTKEGQLFFFDAASIVIRREVEREAKILDRHRKGILHWNGSGDPLEMHRPGECRS